METIDTKPEIDRLTSTEEKNGRDQGTTFHCYNRIY